MRLRDALRVQLAWCSNSSGSPFPGMGPQHAVLSLAVWNADAVIAEAEAKVAKGRPCDGVGMNKQRFSLGTKYHDAMRRACGRGSGFQSGPIGFPALVEAVEALGAALEDELSARRS